MLPSRPVAASRTRSARLMLPAEANNLGSVFGGVLLAEADRIAYVTATRHAQAPCVTASLDRVDFLAPVRVGDIVQFSGEVTSTGRTSMEIAISMECERLAPERSARVGQAFVTMVAIDAAGRPIPVPPLELRTAEERRRFEDGRARMLARQKSRRSATTPG